MRVVLLVAILALLALAGVAVAQDNTGITQKDSFVESDSSLSVGSRAESFAEAESDLDSQLDDASEAESEMEAEAEADAETEQAALADTDDNTALLETSGQSKHSAKWWWWRHRNAHRAHKKRHFHVNPNHGKRCVRWGHGRGYWKRFDTKKHKQRWIKRFWRKWRHGRHRHHRGGHKWRHHRGGHKWHHRGGRGWGHRHHRHVGHRHHHHRGGHHRHHWGGHRHHHRGGGHRVHHVGGGGGGGRGGRSSYSAPARSYSAPARTYSAPAPVYRAPAPAARPPPPPPPAPRRRRFLFLETESQIQPHDSSLVETAAEAERSPRYWVPGKWKCIEWGARPATIDAPSPPPPVVRPWCESNVWRAGSNWHNRIYYASRCNTGRPAGVSPAPKAPEKRANWCEANAGMKKTDSAGYYYRKCGGAPSAPAYKPLPAGIPKAPKEDRPKWCRDYQHLRWTKNRPYYCSKCSAYCTAEVPSAPPRPAGVPKAPKDTRTWCQKYNWMRWGRHSTYYYVKCGGAPPKSPPKAPSHIEPPPPKTERKPWCVENNFLRYNKRHSAWYYSKCGEIVPSNPQPAPKCPSFLRVKVTSDNRDAFCRKNEWTKSNRKYRNCYCSRCSCPAAALPPQRPPSIPQPPPKRRDRKGWCVEFNYLRYGQHAAYYCDRCGCSKPVVVKPTKNVPPVTANVHAWCIANQRFRYYTKATGVHGNARYFYSVCGAKPILLPEAPANVETPPPRAKRVDWCKKYESLATTDSKHWYCFKCNTKACPLPPPPPKLAPKLSPSFCDDNRYMTETSQAAYYYSKCGGAPLKNPAALKAPKKVVNIAAPAPGSSQVHVHVNVAAPAVKKSNAGLQAMVDRVAKKNEEASAKMEAILKKLRSQDCRDGNCLPKTHKEMEQWKADWILETEETGKAVP